MELLALRPTSWLSWRRPSDSREIFRYIEAFQLPHTGTYVELGVNPDTVCVVLCNLIYTVTEETNSGVNTCSVCATTDTYKSYIIEIAIKSAVYNILNNRSLECYAR